MTLDLEKMKRLCHAYIGGEELDWLDAWLKNGPALIDEVEALREKLAHLKGVELRLIVAVSDRLDMLKRAEAAEARLKEVETRAERLREALKYYADNKHADDHILHAEDGTRAREALAADSAARSKSVAEHVKEFTASLGGDNNG